MNYSPIWFCKDFNPEPTQLYILIQSHVMSIETRCWFAHFESQMPPVELYHCSKSCHKMPFFGLSHYITTTMSSVVRATTFFATRRRVPATFNSFCSQRMKTKATLCDVINRSSHDINLVDVALRGAPIVQCRHHSTIYDRPIIQSSPFDCLLLHSSGFIAHNDSISPRISIQPQRICRSRRLAESESGSRRRTKRSNKGVWVGWRLHKGTTASLDATLSLAAFKCSWNHACTHAAHNGSWTQRPEEECAAHIVRAPLRSPRHLLVTLLRLSKRPTISLSLSLFLHFSNYSAMHSMAFINRTRVLARVSVTL